MGVFPQKLQKKIHGLALTIGDGTKDALGEFEKMIDEISADSCISILEVTKTSCELLRGGAGGEGACLEF